jgi:hypothetical protein
MKYALHQEKNVIVVTSVTDYSSFPSYKVVNIVCIGVLDQSIRQHKTAAVERVRLFINVVLPIKKFDATDLINFVSWIQMKNHRAYLSH